MMWYQCKLRRNTEVITGWIEERGAKEGSLVELKDEPGELWTVETVFTPGMDDESLKKDQKLNRGSLSSIKE